MKEHACYSYHTEEEIIDLLDKTGLTRKQLRNRLVNIRRVRMLFFFFAISSSSKTVFRFKSFNKISNLNLSSVPFSNF